MAKEENVWSAALPVNDPSLCARCGSSLIDDKKAPICEDILLPHPGQAILAAQRKFSGLCPICGPTVTLHRGHHSTYSAKKMGELFPKSTQRTVKAKLSSAERKTFDNAMKGKRAATNEEILRWTQLINAEN